MTDVSSEPAHSGGPSFVAKIMIIVVVAAVILATWQIAPVFMLGFGGIDPVNVGYVTTMPSDGNATLLDTSEPGNSNAGHNYGGTMSDAERRALIEYIKSL